MYLTFAFHISKQCINGVQEDFCLQSCRDIGWFFLFHVDVTVPRMENPCLIPVDVLGELSEVGRLML